MTTHFNADLIPMKIPVPECVVAPFRDTAPAPTQRISKEEKNSCRDETSSDTQIPLHDMRIIDIAEIYTVGTESGKSLLEESDPFVHKVALQGPKGEAVRIRGVFDDGATMHAIDLRVFETLKHRLSRPKDSDHILRMADGSLVPSSGKWIGIIEVGGVSLEGAFEIFPSGNSWALLFGKPLLKTFDMTHRYKNDTVVNIPIYSPFFSFIIYSLNYFPDIFSIYLCKAYYLKVTDIFLHFSIKNTLYLLGTCSNTSRTCSDILGNSPFRQAASKVLYSAQISACRLNHYLT